MQTNFPTQYKCNDCETVVDVSQKGTQICDCGKLEVTNCIRYVTINGGADQFEAIGLEQPVYDGLDIWDITDTDLSEFNPKILKERLLEIEKEQTKKAEYERQESIAYHKAVAKIRARLHEVCIDNKGEHDWTRENYLYSSLYCSKCGVFK